MALSVDFVDGQNFTARSLRLAASAGPLQAGVVQTPEYPQALKVVPASGGSIPRSYRIRPGQAWVRASGTRHGFYHVVNNANYDLYIPPGIPDPGTSDYSVDWIVVRIHDIADIAGSTEDRAKFEVVTGADISAPNWNIVNPLNNAPAVPPNSLPLAVVKNRWADVAMGGSEGNDFLDTRAFAYGGRREVTYVGGNEVTTSTTYTGILTPSGTRFYVPMNPTNTAPNFMRIRLTGQLTMAAATYTALFRITGGNSLLGDGTQFGAEYSISNATISRNRPIALEWIFQPPSAGTWYFTPEWKLNAAQTTTLTANSTSPVTLMMEEIVTPNQNNGAS